MGSKRRCRACEECEVWDEEPELSLQVGVMSGLGDAPGGQVLLDHRGEPFPRPPKLVGYERRERFES